MDRRIVPCLILAVAWTVFALAEPRFLSPRAIESMLLWMPILAVVAVGQFFVVLTGGIDVSVGSILGFSGIAIGLALHQCPWLPPILCMAIGTLAGCILGAINGSLVAYVKAPPLVVTIGTLAAFRGMTFLISKGEQVDASVIPSSLTELAKHGPQIGSITLNALFLFSLVIAAMAAFVANRTVAGKNAMAFGSDPAGARLKGISDAYVQFAAFLACGALAGLGAAIYAARFGFVNPGGAGQDLELSAIAAVAIGGVKLTGGSGSIGGVILGCMVIASINVGLTVMGIDANWQLLAYGAVISIAVLIDGFGRRGTQP